MANYEGSQGNFEYRDIDWEMQHRLARRLTDRQTAAGYYFIDIAGTCNLKCPSCAVGNMPAVFPKGLMSLEKLEAVLEKIQRENVGKGRIFIDLYNWGEPLLHPKIGQIIGMVKRAGFGCGISSNLVFGKYIQDVAEAAPDYIRISLSGYFNDTYQQTHRGGDINAVKSNMYMLRYHLDKCRNDLTVVQVGFHIYRTNFPNDFERMFRLADELKFLFSPTLATIMPVEKAVVALENGDLSREDRDLIGKLVVPPTRWRELNLASNIVLDDCQYRTQRTTINFDGSVALCCATFSAETIVARDFIETPDEDLVAARNAHPYCGTCMSNRLHYVYTGVYPDGLKEEAEKVLGEQYGQYLRASRNIGERDYLYLNGALRSVQNVYDAGIAELHDPSPEKLRRAEMCFDFLTKEAPWFGEGFYQAAAVKARLGRKGEAWPLIQRAIEMLPGNRAYEALAAELR